MPVHSRNVKNEVDLAFSDSVYVPESLLSMWLNLSAILITVSLLFYHMSRVKSLKVHPVFASVLAIGFIFISTFYLFSALGPYAARMQYAINKCGNMDECDDIQMKHLNMLYHSYLGVGIITCIIQIIIVYLIVNTV
tara:strand:- start:794 stop:1204 length:411 start_codon:yes stop_codon:yes gene_type:complete